MGSSTVENATVGNATMMKPMTQAVVPVLDLMIGQIVLAAGGNRDEYRPVHSKLTSSSVPVDVAKSMFYQTGCDCLYLADIDSFAGAEPNWKVYNELLDVGFGLWIDANWMDKKRSGEIARQIKTRDRLKVIVSSETMAKPDQFSVFGELVDAGITPIFSLDKKGESIITQPGELSQLTPFDLVQSAYNQGVRDFIVLDLSSVGTMSGIAGEHDAGLQPLLREIAHELPDVNLTSGGGVRSAEDAQHLLSAGCQHVLVASAIHECRFTPDDVTRLRPSSSSCQL
jgi:phosphoribosylformimino-5-aminoimidazole carboxamide ribotide isomerase